MSAPSLWKEGHRPFFLVFPGLGVLALGAWAWALEGGLAVRPVDHAALMIWGVLGSAVLGFLLTAYPRQNEATPPTRGALAVALVGQLGLAGSALGSWLGLPLGGLATLLGALVWGGMTLWAARIAWASLRRRWDDTTAAVPVALALGLVGWLLARQGSDPRLGVALGLHGFLIGLALALLDRLLPFFASKAISGYAGQRGTWFVGPLLGALALPALGLGPAAVWDLVVLVLLARQLVRWRADQCLRTPLIAVLLLGVGWLVLGYGADALGGQGPLATHLWTIGGLCTLVLGIATRVTRGHAGLPLALDGWAAAAIGLVQVAVLLRAVLPAALGLGGAAPLVGAAAILGAALAIWLARHAPMLFRG